MKKLTITSKDIKAFFELSAVINAEYDVSSAKINEAITKKNKKYYGMNAKHQRNLRNKIARRILSENFNVYQQLCQLFDVFPYKAKNVMRVFDPDIYCINLLSSVTEKELDMFISDHNQFIDIPFMRKAAAASFDTQGDHLCRSFFKKYRARLVTFHKLSKVFAGAVSAKRFVNSGRHPGIRIDYLSGSSLTNLSHLALLVCGMRYSNRIHKQWIATVLTAACDLHLLNYFRNENAKIVVDKMMHTKYADICRVLKLIRTDSSIHISPFQKSTKMASVVHWVISIISDGMRIYLQYKDHGARTIDANSSLYHQIMTSLYNHENNEVFHERALMAEEEQYKAEENVPAPVPAGPEKAEVYRLKTLGEIRKAGKQCGNCVGGYAKNKDLWIYRKGNVVAGLIIQSIENGNPQIYQCYDAGNRITTESQAFEKELLALVSGQ